MKASTEKRLKELFDSFDLNKDGQISKQELIEGYCKVFKNKAKAKSEADKIMHHVDINKNGVIDYNGILNIPSLLEFLMVNMQIREVMEERKLRQAFDFYDQVRSNLEESRIVG